MSAAPMPTPMASATYHFFSSSLSSRATLGPLLLRHGSRRRRLGGKPAGRGRIGRGGLERQEHFPAVGSLRAAVLAEQSKHGLRKERAFLQILQIRRDRRRSQRLALHGDLVSLDSEIREPHQIRKGLRNFVHQTDRPLLVGLEVVNQRNLFLEVLFLLLVTLHLIDDRAQSVRLEARSRDLLAEGLLLLDADQGPAPGAQQAHHQSSEEQKIVQAGTRRKDGRLLARCRCLGFGEEVYPDQAASSPMWRTASPTAMVRLGAFSVSHSDDTEPPAMSI